MTAQVLSAAAGIVLSLGFSYVPKLAPWYDAQEGTTKRLIMLGLLALVSVGVFGISCAGWFNFNITCDQAGIEELVSAFFLALVANQSTFLITPKKG